MLYESLILAALVLVATFPFLAFAGERAARDRVGQRFRLPSPETELTKLYDKPVFVYGYPTRAKAFYMEPWPGRPDVSKSVDLLAPEGYGEIIGGSERISDPELLHQAHPRMGPAA